MGWNLTEEGAGRHRRPRGESAPRICTCGTCSGPAVCPPPTGPPRHARPRPEELAVLVTTEPEPAEADDDQPLAPVVPLRRRVRWNH